MHFRRPTVQDADWMWCHSVEGESFGADAQAAYLRMCEDFAETSVVAESEHERVGFLIGYRMPDTPETTVIWQVVTEADDRRPGIAREMIASALDRVPGTARFLQAIVAPSNRLARELCRDIAHRLATPYTEESAYPDDVLPGRANEKPLKVRIGPFTPSALSNLAAATRTEEEMALEALSPPSEIYVRHPTEPIKP